MTEMPTGVFWRIIVPVIAGAWPLAPIIGMAIRGTWRFYVLDTALGLLLSGTIFFLVAAFFWRPAHWFGFTKNLPPVRRLVLLGLMMIFWGLLGLLSELLFCP